MITIKEQIVDASVKPKFVVKVGGSYVEVIYSMIPKYITIHQTGNTNKGADAQAHADLQSKGNPRDASWHVQVDDKEAIKSFSYKEACLHAGDGITGEGNRKGIAVEICINSDGDYTKAIENAVDVVKQLQKKFNIPTTKVKQHNAFSGKNCPRQIRANVQGISWADFIGMVNDKPKKSTQYKARAQDTNSIVDFLNGHGLDASFTHRAELAKRHNIANYSGTAKQNLYLLGVLRTDKTSAKKQPKTNYKLMGTESVVDFMNANSMDASYDNRKVLAKEYGIKSYRGTASQNTTLLEKIKAD